MSGNTVKYIDYLEILTFGNFYQYSINHILMSFVNKLCKKPICNHRDTDRFSAKEANNCINEGYKIN